ncbi:MAG: thymidine kinase [Gemmatimonadota bacterium]|nr:MAG: thymidine kinase [Gemmatimonadota bacterium]
MQGLPALVQDFGWVEVICGSMFSGKSEELIRRLVRARIARQPVQAFKPSVDNRYAKDHVVSHSGQRIASVEVDAVEDIRRLVQPATKVIGIDEAQFLGLDLVPLVEELANEGRRVIVAGLDQDYQGVPFEPIPQLMAIAESVTKTMAVCMVCGHSANRTQRLVAAEDRVLVGAAEAYEARCRRCWTPDPALASRDERAEAVVG